MKLLHVIPSIDPRGGGPIECIRQLQRPLEELGHAAEVASLDAPRDAWASGSGLPVHALGPAAGGYRFGRGLLPWLRANCTAYDAVLVHGIWQYHSFAVWRALRHASTPYFVFTHGMLDPWFRRTYPLKHVKKWLYWPWAEYRVLRDATAVLFTCEEERQLARQSFWLYRCREAVVHLGTAPPALAPSRQTAAFYEAFPEAGGRRVLLFLGRIHPKKGCDLLIQAFADVARSEPALLLVMAGPDQVGWRQALEALASRVGVTEQVLWTGMLSGDLKWGAFQAAEAFVLPSHQENFGIAVVEALACGKPVLISDKVNIWREIAADGAGLVEPDTAAGIARQLRTWLAMTAADRASLEAEARASYERRFRIGRAAQALVEALNNYSRLAS